MSIYVSGIPQDVDPRDGTLVVGEAKTGETFYAGVVAQKTGNGTQTLSDANDTVTAGYYAATDLRTVDGDLVAANISDEVTVFGIAGSLAAGVQTEDTLGEATTGQTADATTTLGYKNMDITTFQEITLATVSPTFDNNSMQVAVGMGLCNASDFEQLIMRLYIGGNVVDSVYVSTAVGMIILKGTEEVSGEQECKLTCYNEDTSTHTLYGYTSDNGVVLPFGIGVGSIKV